MPYLIELFYNTCFHPHDVICITYSISSNSYKRKSAYLKYNHIELLRVCRLKIGTLGTQLFYCVHYVIRFRIGTSFICNIIYHIKFQMSNVFSIFFIFLLKKYFVLITKLILPYDYRIVNQNVYIVS